MSTVKSFQELAIWQLAIELDKRIHHLTNTGNVAQEVSLKDQITRSAGSIADKIAEGFGRGGRTEFTRFLNIAKGSASEVESQLTRGFNRSLFGLELFTELVELTQKTGKEIDAFIKYLNHSGEEGTAFQDSSIKNGNQDPGNDNQGQATINKDARSQTTNAKRRTEQVNTANAAAPLGAYPHARKAGNLLFLSGIGSRNPKDNSIPGLVLDDEGNKIDYDIEAECHSVFKNVKAVLGASGSTWDKIIDVTVFLTNMKKDFPTYNRIYGEYFTEVQACRTTVEVVSLPTPIAIELKVIALI